MQQVKQTAFISPTKQPSTTTTIANSPVVRHSTNTTRYKVHSYQHLCNNNPNRFLKTQSYTLNKPTQEKNANDQKEPDVPMDAPKLNSPIPQNETAQGTNPSPTHLIDNKESERQQEK